MSETVNYIATHVRRGAAPSKVDALRILGRGAAGTFEDRDLMARAEVIALIQSGEDVYVWDYAADQLGGAVDLVHVQGEDYLRLDGELLRADNLGDLPQV